MVACQGSREKNTRILINPGSLAVFLQCPLLTRASNVPAGPGKMSSSPSSIFTKKDKERWIGIDRPYADDWHTL